MTENGSQGRYWVTYRQRYGSISVMVPTSNPLRAAIVAAWRLRRHRILGPPQLRWQTLP